MQRKRSDPEPSPEFDLSEPDSVTDDDVVVMNERPTRRNPKKVASKKGPVAKRQKITPNSEIDIFVPPPRVQQDFPDHDVQEAFSTQVSTPRHPKRSVKRGAIRATSSSKPKLKFSNIASTQPKVSSGKASDQRKRKVVVPPPTHRRVSAPSGHTNPFSTQFGGNNDNPMQYPSPPPPSPPPVTDTSAPLVISVPAATELAPIGNQPPPTNADGRRGGPQNLPLGQEDMEIDDLKESQVGNFVWVGLLGPIVKRGTNELQMACFPGAPIPTAIKEFENAGYLNVFECTDDPNPWVAGGLLAGLLKISDPLQNVLGVYSQEEVTKCMRLATGINRVLDGGDSIDFFNVPGQRNPGIVEAELLENLFSKDWCLRTNRRVQPLPNAQCAVLFSACPLVGRLCDAMTTYGIGTFNYCHMSYRLGLDFTPATSKCPQRVWDVATEPQNDLLKNVCVDGIGASFVVGDLRQEFKPALKVKGQDIGRCVSMTDCVMVYKALLSARVKVRFEPILIGRHRIVSYAYLKFLNRPLSEVAGTKVVRPECWA